MDTLTVHPDLDWHFEPGDHAVTVEATWADHPDQVARPAAPRSPVLVVELPDGEPVWVEGPGEWLRSGRLVIDWRSLGYGMTLTHGGDHWILVQHTT